VVVLCFPSQVNEVSIPHISMSLCEEKLCFHLFQGLGNTFLSQWCELRHEAAFHNRQHCGLSTDSLALSFVLRMYNVPYFHISDACYGVIYGVTWVKLLHYWHIIVGEKCFMSEDLHEILQNSSNEEYTENKHCEGSNVAIHKGSSSIAPLSLSFGIKGRSVFNSTPYHFKPR